MEHFPNKSESFYREIRKIEIYNAADAKFMESLVGIFPDPATALYIFDVIPQEFSRKIPRKKKDGDYFHEVDLGFPLLDMSEAAVAKYQAYFNRQEFAVGLISNTAKTLLGNDREPLTIEVLDNIKDDASGSDEFYLSITGETIIAPKIRDI